MSLRRGLSVFSTQVRSNVQPIWFSLKGTQPVLEKRHLVCTAVYGQTGNVAQSHYGLPQMPTRVSLPEGRRRFFAGHILG